jgi:hypothetical protein
LLQNSFMDWEWANSVAGLRARATDARNAADAFAATKPKVGSSEWLRWVLLESAAVRLRDQAAEMAMVVAREKSPPV